MKDQPRAKVIKTMQSQDEEARQSLNDLSKKLHTHQEVKKDAKSEKPISKGTGKNDFEKAIQENFKQIENDNKEEKQYINSIKDTLIKSK